MLGDDTGMGPTSSSTYWVACLLYVPVPDGCDYWCDDDGGGDCCEGYEYGYEVAVEDLVAALPDVIRDDIRCDALECDVEVVFRVPVAHGANPSAEAIAAVRRAAARSGLQVGVEVLRYVRQTDLLSRLHRWNGCARCASGHKAKRCLDCGNCLDWLAEDLMVA